MANRDSDDAKGQTLLDPAESRETGSDTEVTAAAHHSGSEVERSGVDKAKEPQRILLRFRDQDDKPVPYFEFSYGLRDRSTVMDEFRNGTSALDIPDAQLRPHRGVSDANGEFELLEGREFEGFKAHELRLASIATGYAFAKVGEVLGDIGYGEYATLLNPTGGTIDVSLIETRQVMITVEYADGEPFQGQLLYATPVNPMRPKTISLALGETPSIEIPPVEGVFRFRSTSRRPGFETSNSWQYKASEIPSDVRLVISRDPDQTAVEVNLEGWPRDEPVSVSIFHQGSSSEESKGGQVWTSRKLRPSSAPYLIRIEGESGVWSSGSFRLEDNDRKEFVALPQEPFRIRARFVDDEGNPRWGACINTVPCRYPDWSRFYDMESRDPERLFDTMREYHTIVYSGKDGVAEIGGLPPGDMAITLEARGCEVIRKTIVGRPGETVDLGDISFQPANGRIVIDLSNREEGREYSIAIMGIAGAGGFPRRLEGITQDSVVIDNLPLRPYQLAITGAPLPNPRVDLAEQGTVHVKVDVGN